MTIKTKHGVIYEMDIEDAFWRNPDKIEFVDGWIGRQMTLCNNKVLDLVGYKYRKIRKAGEVIDFPYIQLVELKSRKLNIRDLLQVKMYQFYLAETIENNGFLNIDINPILIGTGSVTERFLEYAYSQEVSIFTISADEYNNITIESGSYLDMDYHESNKLRSRYYQGNGEYDNLINFLLPLQPDFIRDQYSIGVGNG
jgi:hypothetical protein